MVVIKGLTMPKYCYECPCKIQCKLIDSIDIERPADCPLEEINGPVQHSNCEMLFADAKYIKHGRWIKVIGENGVTDAVCCSICGFEDNRYELFNYCPNCGADMQSGKNE